MSQRRIGFAGWRGAIICGVLLSACVTRNPVLFQPGRIPGNVSGELKVHLFSGDLIVLKSMAQSDSGFRGAGTRYGPDRRILATGQFFIPRDSIALLEGETRSMGRTGASITLMGVWTVFWTAVTLQCIADPKSCFGSCPTFYADGYGDEVPQAEGFSASIARALEARDVDALGERAKPKDGQFSIRMTNEALETHAVQSLRLLAVPRPSGGRVFQGRDGQFYPAPQEIRSPDSCRGVEGDCRAAVARLDRLERKSNTDSTDLAARETMELEFAPVAGRAGVVLGARQSLVSTFLFYQTIAYLGRGAGEWLAALERAGPQYAGNAMGMAQALGGIEVEVENVDGTWRAIGAYDEAGPIATDVIVLPFSADSAAPVRVRLRMAKGAWRVNWVGVTPLGEPVAPLRLAAVLVQRGQDSDSAALGRLRDADRYLVTYPGDAYRISFTLPADLTDPELFLEAQGYYYEWMRGEWLAEENPVMAALALGDPSRALRQLAPEFKRVESRMEGLFWQSRFGR